MKLITDNPTPAVSEHCYDEWLGIGIVRMDSETIARLTPKVRAALYRAARTIRRQRQAAEGRPRLRRVK